MDRKRKKILVVSVFATVVVLFVIGAAIVNSGAANTKPQPTLAEHLILNSKDIDAYWVENNPPYVLGPGQNSYKIVEFSYQGYTFSEALLVWSSSASCLSDYSNMSGSTENVSIGDHGRMDKVFGQLGELVFIWNNVTVYVSIREPWPYNESLGMEALTAIAQIQDLKTVMCHSAE